MDQGNDGPDVIRSVGTMRRQDGVVERWDGRRWVRLDPDHPAAGVQPYPDPRTAYAVPQRFMAGTNDRHTTECVDGGWAASCSGECALAHSDDVDTATLPVLQEGGTELPPMTDAEAARIRRESRGQEYVGGALVGTDEHGGRHYSAITPVATGPAVSVDRAFSVNGRVAAVIVTDSGGPRRLIWWGGVDALLAECDRLDQSAFVPGMATLQTDQVRRLLGVHDAMGSDGS